MGKMYIAQKNAWEKVKWKRSKQRVFQKTLRQNFHNHLFAQK